jgi:predicted house-cleaning NTP pyrophosphatase (Maf/HAM1 superfamily)
LADVDETPKKDEEPEATRIRVAEAKTKITSAKAAQEPPPTVDEAPRAGEAPETTKKRVAAAKAVLKSRQ